MRYFLIPGLLAVVMFQHWRMGHYFMSAFHGALLVYWTWRYPWFVRLVIRSLLGLEP